MAATLSVTLRLSVALLGLLSTRTSAQDSPPPRVEPVVSVPFRLQRGLVMLPATVNDSASFSFLLDTGYSICTVHPELADSLNLRRAGSVTIVGIAGEEEAPVYSGAIFRLAERVQYAPRRVAAVPSERERRRRRDGIIGAGFFRRFVVQLDFQAQSARLFEPANYSYAGPGEVVPIRFRRQTPTIRATVLGGAGEAFGGQFEVDTGCDDGVCLGREFVATNRLDRWAETKGAGAKQGIGGSARILSGTLPALKLGGAQLERVAASFFQDGSPAEQGMAGHIGMGALRRFQVTFDYARERLILERR